MATVTFLPRHLAIAKAITGGDLLLQHAARPDVLDEQRRIVAAGGKPVLAYSAFIAGLGLSGRELDILKRFAGEVAAHAVESVYGAVRAAGSKVIAGDPVFVSGQPFRFQVGACAAPPPPDRFREALATMLKLAEPSELRWARDLIDQRLVPPQSAA